jgi:hypothetical protein
MTQISDLRCREAMCPACHHFFLPEDDHLAACEYGGCDFCGDGVCAFRERADDVGVERLRELCSSPIVHLEYDGLVRSSGSYGTRGTGRVRPGILRARRPRLASASQKGDAVVSSRMPPDH